MIHRREADLSFSDLTITLLRAKYVSFSVPIKMGTLAIFGQRPRDGRKWSFTLYLSTFGQDCWIALAVAYLLFVGAFSVVIQFETAFTVRIK